MPCTVSLFSQVTAWQLDSTSDAINEGRRDSASLYSVDKDTDRDRVKAFYKEQHGEYHSWVMRVVADFC